MSADSTMNELLAVMARLRDPEQGCPWDLAQDYRSIVPHTLEEAYEVAETIEQGDLEHLPEELGDLLFQVVFYARLGEEEGRFDFAGVARGVAQKLRRRHPHVFGDARLEDETAGQVAWEQIKQAEREARGREDASLLSDVPHALPSLSRAMKLGRRAARGGFDWDDADGVFEKIYEEIDELRAEISEQGTHQRRHEELGDLLLAISSLARHLELDAETALRDACRRFERRFREVEAGLARQGRQPSSALREQMEQLWRQASRTD